MSSASSIETVSTDEVFYSVAHVVVVVVMQICGDTTVPEPLPVESKIHDSEWQDDFGMGAVLSACSTDS